MAFIWKFFFGGNKKEEEQKQIEQEKIRKKRKLARYDVLDSVIEEVHMACVRIDYIEKRSLRERLQMVVETLLQAMKDVDPTFKNIFNRIGYTGSYFEGVRVNEATEFDLNLILNFRHKMEVDEKKSLPGFVAIKVLETLNDNPMKNWLFYPWFSSYGYLDPVKVKRWFEGVFARAVEHTGFEIGNCRIVKWHKNGPAFTLDVISVTPPTKIINIDFVPVFEFKSSSYPREAPRHQLYYEPWYIVPKEQCYDDVQNWRIAFPIQEKRMLRSNNYLKYCLRLLKQLRDNFRMFDIGSYYIKTVFLIEIARNEDHSTWFSANRRGYLFMHMLLKFRTALAEENLPFFWDERFNLLGNLHKDSLKNSYGRVNNFIKHIEYYIDQRDQEGLNNYIRSKLIPRLQPGSLASVEPYKEDSSCTIL